MNDGAWWTRLTPPWLRTVPADLVATAGFTFLTLCAVFLPVVRETPLRTMFGVLFVLFVPGYALVAALFPAARTTQAAGSDGIRDRHSLTDIERGALSLGASITVVPLVGILLNFSPVGLRLVPIVVSLTVFVLATTLVAVYRRQKLAPEDRFELPWRALIERARAGVLETDSHIDRVLNVLLVISVVAATVSFAYAVAAPQDGESFTEFYLLTETSTGELTARGYPSEFVVGDPRSLVVGVENQEQQPVNYTIVVELHEVETENGTDRVLQAARLRTFEARLEHNETWQRRHSLAPELLGEELRLTYMLYRGTPPETPAPENAYRELHVWVDVREDR
jgi:uncharacterized membrane protein